MPARVTQACVRVPKVVIEVFDQIHRASGTTTRAKAPMVGDLSDLADENDLFRAGLKVMTPVGHHACT
jgi:hypothetical protein